MEAITFEVCQEIVARHFTGEVTDFTLKPISGEKRGALGEYYNLIIKTASEEFGFFVKTVLERPNRPEFTNFVTSKENRFYSIIEELRSCVDSLDCSFVPRCYFQADTFLVLEDFSGSEYRDGKFGCQCVDMALAKLAKLHAASIFYERALGGDLGSADFLNEALFASDVDFVASKYAGGIVNGILQLMKHEGDDLKMKEKFRQFADECLRRFNERSEFTCVWSHGDLSTNNLLFRYEGDTLADCKLIDFQMIRYAPPVHDVNMLIYLNCDAATIRDHLGTFLGNYYEYLKIELELQGINLNDVISEREYYTSCKAYWSVTKFIRIYYKAFQAATKKRALLKVAKPLDLIMQENGFFIVEIMRLDEELRNDIREILNDIRMSLKYPFLPTECCLMIMTKFCKNYQLLDYQLKGIKGDDYLLKITVLNEESKSEDHTFFLQKSVPTKVYEFYLWTKLKCIRTCLLSKFEDVMIFEDLQERYKHVELRTPFSLDEVKTVMAALASLHAFGFTSSSTDLKIAMLSEEISMSTLENEKIIDVNELNNANVFKSDAMMLSDIPEAASSFIEDIPKLAANLVTDNLKLAGMLESVSGHPNENFPDISEIAPTYTKQKFLRMLTPEDPDPNILHEILKSVDISVTEFPTNVAFRNTICHGYLTPDNIAILYENNKPVSCKLDNFKYYMFGPPSDDVMHFLMFNTTRSFRRYFLRDVQECYYRELGWVFEKYGLDIAEVMGFADFLEDCNRSARGAAVKAAVYHRRALIDEKVVLLGDDWLKLQEESLRNDPVYIERQFEATEDLMEIFHKTKCEKK